MPGDGLLHRFLVARVVLHGKAWGYLAVMEFGSRFTALDLATSRHAATAIAIELSVEGRATAADRQAREGLVRDLVNGLEDHAALVRRAERLSFRMASPHLVCLLAAQDEAAPLSTDAVERAYAEIAPGEEPWLTAVPQNGVALVLELDEDCPRARGAGQGQGDGRAAAGAPRREADRSWRRSRAPAWQPADYGCAYKETQQVLGCLRSLRGCEDAALSLLAADDLGAARLMLTMVDGAEADRFTRNTLGPLLEHGQPHARGAARHRPRVLRRRPQRAQLGEAPGRPREHDPLPARARARAHGARRRDGLRRAADRSGGAADPQDPGPAAGAA